VYLPFLQVTSKLLAEAVAVQFMVAVVVAQVDF
jgi:hypothetical protein